MVASFRSSVHFSPDPPAVKYVQRLDESSNAELFYGNSEIDQFRQDAIFATQFPDLQLDEDEEDESRELSCINQVELSRESAPPLEAKGSPTRKPSRRTFRGQDGVRPRRVEAHSSTSSPPRRMKGGTL